MGIAQSEAPTWKEVTGQPVLWGWAGESSRAGGCCSRPGRQLLVSLLSSELMLRTGKVRGQEVAEALWCGDLPCSRVST